MNTQKGFAPILIILLGLVVIGGGIYFYTQNPTQDIVKSEVVIEDSLPVAKEEAKKEVAQQVETTKKNLFENNDYSFTYNSEDDCLKVNSEYLNKEGKEGVWLCPGANISAMVSGTPDEAIDRMIYPGGPDSDGIWGKACFYDEKRTTPNGYTVRYFEDPDVSKLWGSGNCGTHPTKQSAESVGNMNIYFVISSEDNKYVLIEDINNSTSTDKVWGIINSFKFK